MLATRARAGLTFALILGGYLVITFATPLRAESAAIDSASRFVFGFFVGGALYLFADKIKLSLVAVLLLGARGLRRPWHAGLRDGVQGGAWYGLIWFALVPAGPIRRFNLIGDYSYGLYILCFPIQQTFVMLDPGITPWALFICSFPAVLFSPSCHGTSSSTPR